MSVFTKIKNLFIEPALFFENPKRGLAVPFIITLVYAVISALCALPGVKDALKLTAEMGVPLDGMETVMYVTTGVSAFFTVFVTWIAMSLLFLITLKIFAKSAINFKEVLNVTSYGAIPLAICAGLECLIGLFVGTPLSWASLVLSAAVLFMTMPIWVKGFAAFEAGPEKKILVSVIVAAAITAAVSGLAALGTLGL